MPPRKKATVEPTVPSFVSPPISVEKITAVKEKTNTKSALENLRVETIKEVNHLINQLITDIDQVENLKKQVLEETEIKKRQQKQTEEEQTFTFLMNQRKKKADFEEQLSKEQKTFAEIKQKTEQEFKTKKEELDQKMTEYKELKNQVAAFPKELQKSVDEVEKRTTTDLKKEFDTEKKLFLQKYESDLRLRDQHIISLQQLVKQQEKEIVTLKSETNKAMDQVKDLAVAVIKGKEKDLQSPLASS